MGLRAEAQLLRTTGGAGRCTLQRILMAIDVAALYPLLKPPGIPQCLTWVDTLTVAPNLCCRDRSCVYAVHTLQS